MHFYTSLIRLGESESSAHILQRIDHYNTIRFDFLHHGLHDILRQCNAAACIRFCRAEAVKEDRGASSGCTVLIEADIKAVLILIFVVNNVFAVFHIEIREFSKADHLIVVHAFP